MDSYPSVTVSLYSNRNPSCRGSPRSSDTSLPPVHSTPDRVHPSESVPSLVSRPDALKTGCHPDPKTRGRDSELPRGGRYNEGRGGTKGDRE